MKGQYQIINEILLFGMSAVIVFSIAGVLSFATESMNTQIQREQYFLMGNIASMAMTKAFICGKFADCTVSTEMPAKLSGAGYTMELSRGKVDVSNFETGTRFSINTLDFKKNIGGFVSSSGRYFKVSNENGTMLLSR
jgi:hypothetical protein